MLCYLKSAIRRPSDRNNSLAFFTHRSFYNLRERKKKQIKQNKIKKQVSGNESYLIFRIFLYLWQRT